MASSVPGLSDLIGRGWAYRSNNAAWHWGLPFGEQIHARRCRAQMRANFRWPVCFRSWFVFPAPPARLIFCFIFLSVSPGPARHLRLKIQGVSAPAVSLPLFECMEILGRDLSVRRLQYALEALATGGSELKGKTLDQLEKYYEATYGKSD